jgi:hypothetical protein
MMARWAALAASMIVLGSAPRAQAAPPVGGETAEPLQVEIVLVGAGADDLVLGARVQSWFGSSAVVSVSRQDALIIDNVLKPRADRHALAWLTLRSPTVARIYFAFPGEKGSAPRYLYRDVPIEHGLDELGSERVAQVVHSSVSAIVEGQGGASRLEIEHELAADVPKSRPVVEERAAIPVVAPTASGSSLVAEVTYRFTSAGGEGLAHGPGLALGATAPTGNYRLGAVLRGEYTVPRSATFDGVTLRWSGGVFRIGGRADLVLDSATRFGVEAGPGLAWVLYDPTATGISAPIPRSSGSDQRPFGFVALGISRSMAHLRVGARAEIDVYARRSHYDLDTGTGSRELVGAALAQPSLLIEIAPD